MEHNFWVLYLRTMRSQFVFALIFCAAVFPMLPLQDLPDPLAATHWYTSTDVHSAALAFMIALAYAAATYFWLRANPGSRPLVWFACGAIIGLIPGLFYAALRPDLATQSPITSVLLGGVASGALLGGPAYLLLRHFRSRDHVA